MDELDDTQTGDLADRQRAGRPPYDPPRNDLPYREAMHGVQAAVSMRLAREYPLLPDWLLRALKHIRVGVDSAQVNDGALARLLIKKGLITSDEYVEEIRLEANRELDRQEDSLAQQLGRPVTLR